MYEVIVWEKQYIDQDDAQVVISFQLPSRDWPSIENSDAWHQVEGLLREMSKAEDFENSEKQSCLDLINQMLKPLDLRDLHSAYWILRGFTQGSSDTDEEKEVGAR